MNVHTDFISGWSQVVNDGSGIWDRADEAAELIGEQNVSRFTWQQKMPVAASLTAKRPGVKRLVVVYSYGMSEMEQMYAAIAAAGEVVDCLIILVGVNRVADKQAWEKCWVIHPCVEKAVAVVTVYRGAVPGRIPVIPECCPIRNTSPAYRNVEVFWEGVDHVNVVDLPLVRELIAAEIKKLSASDSSSAPADTPAPD